MTVDIINLREAARWDSLVLSFPNYCFFHSSAWLRVLSSTYGYTPYAFTVAGATERTVIISAEVRSAFTGVRSVSLPFSDVVPILTHAEAASEPAVLQLPSYATERKWRYVELRTATRFREWPVAAEFVEHVLDLRRSEGDLFQALRPSTRRNIQKAAAEGVRVIRTTTLEAVRAFYDLHCITRKRHGLPPQPFAFFRHLHREVLETGAGIVILARYHDQTIAAGVFVNSGHKAVFKFGASLPQMQHLRANNLVMWEAISWYAAGGYHSMSLGRTDPQNRGLLQYKDGWGGVRRMVYYSRWPGNPRRSMRFTALQENAISVARRLPLGILRLVGRLLYPHIG